MPTRGPLQPTESAVDSAV